MTAVGLCLPVRRLRHAPAICDAAAQPALEHAGCKTKNLGHSTLALTPMPGNAGASALTFDGSVWRSRSIPGRLNLRTGFRDPRASAPTLLLFMLPRFSCQLPLLPCLMIVRLC